MTCNGNLPRQAAVEDWGSWRCSHLHSGVPGPPPVRTVHTGTSVRKASSHAVFCVFLTEHMEVTFNKQMIRITFLPKISVIISVVTQAT